MKFELLILGVTAFFIANIYNDGKYVEMLKSWKKYYQMVFIGFAGLSAYVFIRKYPGHSQSLLKHANGIIKYMPIDKECGDLLAPLFDMTKNYQGMGMDWQEQRIMNSGAVPGPGPGPGPRPGPGPKGAAAQQGIKRSVSETKKKFVAAQQGWKCGHCKVQLPAWFEVDHNTRLDQGGSNHVNNLVALCRDCHGKKTAFENF